MASIIDTALARTLIAAYQKQNSAPGGPGLLAPNGSFLNGYFIDRESIEEILKDTSLIGLNFRFAKSPDAADGNQNIFTLVFGGALPNPEHPEVEGATPYLNSGNVYDMIAPCPPNCPPPL